MNLGYACINTALSANNIMTNRTMRRKTFEAKGLDYVSDLALLNVKDLKTIVSGIMKWESNYSDYLLKYFPWQDEYEVFIIKRLQRDL